MPTRRVEIIRVTKDGVGLAKRHRKDASAEYAVAEFNRTFRTCRVGNRTFQRIYHSDWSGGNWRCVQDGDSYLIHQKGG